MTSPDGFSSRKSAGKAGSPTTSKGRSGTSVAGNAAHHSEQRGQGRHPPPSRNRRHRAAIRILAAVRTKDGLRASLTFRFGAAACLFRQDAGARADNGTFHTPAVNQNFPCCATDCSADHSAIKGSVPDTPGEPECRGSHYQGDQASHVEFSFKAFGTISIIKHGRRRQNMICVNRAEAALNRPRWPVGRLCSDWQADAWRHARWLQADPHTSATAGGGRRSPQHVHDGGPRSEIRPEPR